MTELVTHRDMANAIRALAMDAVEKAASGHPGMPMGMADVATVLFTRFLKYDPADAQWPDRDRFVLSAGHGSMLLYALLYLTGYPDMGMEDLRQFRQLGSRTPGHPEYHHTAGVETTTGPLGQGISTAVGMALAERLLAARFGADVVDHRTFVLASDGDMMEGVNHEAAALAGHLRLGRLIVLYDDNDISIDGPTSLAVSDDREARYRAYGWHVQGVDGQDAEAVAAAIQAAIADERPSLIACRTTIAFGSPNKAGTAGAHGSPLGKDEVAATRKALGWTAAPFDIPAPILQAWREAGARGGAQRKAWAGRLAALPPADRAEFGRRIAGDLPAGFAEAIRTVKATAVAEQPKVATRVSSQRVLEAINPVVPEMVGGSADLTPSNNTLTKGMNSVTPDDGYKGRYVHYGVREHGMAAAMNGLALHGGIIPYGGTFLVFTDYARPAIRISALTGARVVYVMTHDSIGLGEDGPTHQPVEHLASLRAMPNLLVFRPADTVEAAECWEAALTQRHRPSVLALSRQGVPTLRAENTDQNLSARGAYVLERASAPAKVTLIATGTEVSLAVEARRRLEADGIPTDVVSMPCWELFAEQDAAYREAVLPAGTVKVAIEAASGLGWERWTGCRGRFVGMHGFGASAPAGDLYKHFGITAEAAVHAAKALLAGA